MKLVPPVAFDNIWFEILFAPPKVIEVFVPSLVALITLISGVEAVPTAKVAEASCRFRLEEFVPPVKIVELAPTVRP